MRNVTRINSSTIHGGHDLHNSAPTVTASGITRPTRQVLVMNTSGWIALPTTNLVILTEMR